MHLTPRLFALTSDIDWASEFCIDDFISFAAEHGIKPTLFATHKSEAIQRAGASGAAEIALHPNFLPGSTHGTDIASVIDHVCGLYPQAKCFRSHSLMDGTPITEGFRARGFRYDSNLITFLENNLGPIRHATGMLRFPVFWEDDTHWYHEGMSWDLDAHYDRFLSPGLKILSVHPIHFALNTPSDAFYQSVRKDANRLSGEDIKRLRYKGKGIRTFVSELIERLRDSQIEFHTMHDLYERFAEHSRMRPSTDVGRTTAVSAKEHQIYWQQNEAQKQKALQSLYNRRNALDPYATSRDYNQRELEISAITNALKDEQEGRLVDFGCGNGYTLLSMAKNSRGWAFEGVDFSEELINGAYALRAKAGNDLQSSVEFHCRDAISYIAEIKPASLDAIVTERFILNLPSKETQRSFIQEAARTLKSGGLFLMCEGSMEGFHGLNRLRSAVGLEKIAETSTDNLSAIRFDDAEIESFVGSVGFQIVRKEGFSYFFAMSRVLHPALVHPQPPKFDSKINDLARELQMQLPLTPGVGSNVLWVLRRK